MEDDIIKQLKRRMLPLAGFMILFCIGVAVLAFAELQHTKMEGAHAKNDWRVVGIPLLQHLASAFIVAAIMGVSYEYLVHKPASCKENVHELPAKAGATRVCSPRSPWRWISPLVRSRKQ